MSRSHATVYIVDDDASVREALAWPPRSRRLLSDPLHSAAAFEQALGMVRRGGTVSLNGMTADHDWQVDRLREAGDPQHQSDIDRAVAAARKALAQGEWPRMRPVPVSSPHLTPHHIRRV